MGGVLQYKWGAYCDTDGRSTGRIPFPQSVGAPRVLQYKLGTFKLEKFQGSVDNLQVMVYTPLKYGEAPVFCSVLPVIAVSSANLLDSTTSLGKTELNQY